MARSKKEIGTGFITQMDRYLFGEGTHYQIYDKLGAHPKNYKGKDGFYFAVWAPHAAAVSVVGDFNNWDPDADPMKVLETSGIYECIYPGLKRGGIIQIRHHDTVRQGIIQERSLRFRQRVPSGNRFHHPGYFRLSMEGQYLDGQAGNPGSYYLSTFHLRGASRLLEKGQPGGKGRLLYLHRGSPRAGRLRKKTWATPTWS